MTLSAVRIRVFASTAWCSIAFFCWASSIVAQDQHSTLDLKPAAKYLDDKQSDWFSWRGSRRGDTRCISCHTNATYTLSRLNIGSTHDELKIYRETLLKNTIARVKNLDTNRIFYGGSRADQSKGTEAVLNALILANDDRANNRTSLSDTTKLAFEQLWDQQILSGSQNGSWHWLDFGLNPWESPDGIYYGASLAAIAIGRTPDSYRQQESVKPHADKLKSFLLSPLADNDPDFSLYHQAYLLLAGHEWKGLLKQEQKQKIVNRLLAAQNEDGGWDLAGLGNWKRIDGSEVSGKSDGYATGLVIYAIIKSGNRDHTKIKKGIAWLKNNYDPESGTWPALSVNKDRSNASDRVKGFMIVAATSMSALAVSESQKEPAAGSAENQGAGN